MEERGPDAELVEGENVVKDLLLGVVLLGAAAEVEAEVLVVGRLKPANTGVGVEGVDELVWAVKPPKEARGMAGMAGTEAFGVSISKEESAP